MGLLRVFDILRVEKKCKPKKLEEYTDFYACTKDRCIIRRYDCGTLSTNGKVYKICMLFTYRSKFDEFVINKLNKIKRTYKNFYIKSSTSQNLVNDQ